MSAIEWTDETWNPTTGCDRVSPGCDNCYALTMSARLKAMGQAKYQTDGRPETSGPGFGVQTHPDTLGEPLKWRKPRRVFVNSMSDLFHPQVPEGFVHQVFEVMRKTPQHTYQVLTKRPQRMRSLVSRYQLHLDEYLHQRNRIGGGQPLPNVWLGTSVEDQERADQRIPPLLATPAAVRFLSCEPLLGPVDLGRWLCCPPNWRDVPGAVATEHVRPLHWVIVGGESGPGARPMDLAWPRSIVEQCQAAGVAAFVKQLGSCPTVGTHAGTKPYAVAGKGGEPQGWPADLRVREFPEVPA